MFGVSFQIIFLSDTETVQGKDSLSSYQRPRRIDLNKQGEENRQIKTDVKDKEGNLTMARSFSNTL